MFQESEIVELLMVAFLTPIMAASVRTIHVPGKRLFVAGYLVTVAGYVFSVAEGFLWFDAFNTFEHASYAGAGVLYAIAAVRLLRAAHPAGERS